MHARCVCLTHAQTRAGFGLACRSRRWHNMCWGTWRPWCRQRTSTWLQLDGCMSISCSPPPWCSHGCKHHYYLLVMHASPAVLTLPYAAGTPPSSCPGMSVQLCVHRAGQGEECSLDAHLYRHDAKGSHDCAGSMLIGRLVGGAAPPAQDAGAGWLAVTCRRRRAMEVQRAGKVHAAWTSACSSLAWPCRWAVMHSDIDLLSQATQRSAAEPRTKMHAPLSPRDATGRPAPTFCDGIHLQGRANGDMHIYGRQQQPWRRQQHWTGSTILPQCLTAMQAGSPAMHRRAPAHRCVRCMQIAGPYRTCCSIAMRRWCMMMMPLLMLRVSGTSACSSSAPSPPSSRRPMPAPTACCCASSWPSARSSRPTCGTAVPAGQALCFPPGRHGTQWMWFAQCMCDRLDRLACGGRRASD